MSVNHLRGAFIAYEPDGYPEKKRVLPFRFNPEGLDRDLALEQGDNSQGSGGGGGASGSSSGGDAQQGADASSGTLKESFTVLVRFDAYDRHEALGNLPPELGVAPEVAALEDLMYPAASETEDNADGSQPVAARAKRPTVLFIWGKKRVYPVRITGMSIQEIVHNAELNPVRAEIEVSMEVVGSGEVKDNPAVESALAFTHGHRRKLARLFLDNTADQGSNILPL